MKRTDYLHLLLLTTSNIMQKKLLDVNCLLFVNKLLNISFNDFVQKILCKRTRFKMAQCTFASFPIHFISRLLHGGRQRTG